MSPALIGVAEMVGVEATRDVATDAETFSRRGPWVISSLGFKVKALGRAGMEYVENGQALRLDSEALASKAFIVHAQSLPAAQRTDIADNITRAWRSMGFDVQVQ